MTDRLLTPREAAALFGVDPKTVTRWASAGKVPHATTPNGHHRFRETDLLALRRSDPPPGVDRDGNESSLTAGS